MTKNYELNGDQQKIIPIWIEEEKARLKQEEMLPEVFLDDSQVKHFDEAINTIVVQLFPENKQKKLEEVANEILKSKIKEGQEKKKQIKLPTQFDREQKIMSYRKNLSSEKVMISPNAMVQREDIFHPQVRNDAEVKNGFNNLEGNPDINRIENWSIWCYAWGLNGGDACWSSLYWRYRIWVPNFDTSIQKDRRLVIDPMAVQTGYYDLFAYHIPLLSSPSAEVFLRFWTGTWHWHYTGSGYNPVWSGWRRSHNVVHISISSGNIHQNINVGYPGTLVTTPARFDPPGVHTTPNPINHYGLVEPYDVVDFYVKPQICARTNNMISYARIDFSLIDVPFVTAAFESGYLL